MTIDGHSEAGMMTQIVQAGHILIHCADQGLGASLLAATEGRMRFITSVPIAAATEELTVPRLLATLAEQTGLALRPSDISAVLLSGRPDRLMVLGDPASHDAHAFGHLARLGVACLAQESLVPPARAARLSPWVRMVLDQWQAGGADALVVVIPPGPLPLWAAQFLTALNALPLDDAIRCIFVTSDEALSALLPPAAVHVTRGESLTEMLIATLGRWRLARAAIPHGEATPVIYRQQVLTTAVQAAETMLGRPVAYLDFSAGGTCIVSTKQAVQLAHFPDLDCGRGIGTIIERCGLDRIAHWLPQRSDAPDIRRWALHRMLWPHAALTEDLDRLIAGAFARAAARWMIAESGISIPQDALCVLGPSWLYWSTPAAAMRAVADILALTGAVRVALDVDDLMAAIGFLMRAGPDDLSSLLERDALLPLGTIVPLPTGDPRHAEGGIAVDLVGDDGSNHLTAASAGMTIVPNTGPATLSYRGRRDHRTVAVEVEGGQCGLLLDARPRPLAHSSEMMPSRDSVSARLRSEPRSGTPTDG